jgi:hypothetical protein
MPLPTITLFTAPEPPRNAPSPILISLLLHGTAIGAISLGLTEAARIVVRPVQQRYALRLLELHSTQPSLHSAASDMRSTASGTQPDANRIEYPALAQPALAMHVPTLQKAAHTLIQPNLPRAIADTPVPSVLLWSREQPEQSHLRKLTAPAQATTPPPDVAPSLAPPNSEVRVADIRLSPAPSVTVAPLPAPATTSPLAAHEPQPSTKPAQMASTANAAPAPAAVLSISDLRMKDGTIPLPPVNQAAEDRAQGALSTGSAEAGAAKAEPAKTDPAGREMDKDRKLLEGMHTAAAQRADFEIAPAASASDAAQAADPSPDPSSTNGSSVTRISLPRNGSFGVTVIGSSVTDEYPETAGIWGDRLAYTVYIHTGLARNWIMQYALPAAAGAAQQIRPDAPWPFYIVVPHIAPDDVNAAAILVHGYVNAEGRFEQLAIVSPPGLPRRDSLLSALQEWQFRPAIESRQNTAVEVLLVVPLAQD